MIRRLLELLNLIKPQKPSFCQTPVSGSASRNPYQLVWYKRGWSTNKVKKNNSKYWKWEIAHNGFKCP